MVALCSGSLALPQELHGRGEVCKARAASVGPAVVRPHGACISLSELAVDRPPARRPEEDPSDRGKGQPSRVLELRRPSPGAAAWMFSNASEMGILVWPSSPHSAFRLGI